MCGLYSCIALLSVCLVLSVPDGGWMAATHMQGLVSHLNHRGDMRRF